MERRAPSEFSNERDIFHYGIVGEPTQPLEQRCSDEQTLISVRQPAESVANPRTPLHGAKPPPVRVYGESPYRGLRVRMSHYLREVVPGLDGEPDVGVEKAEPRGFGHVRPRVQLSPASPIRGHDASSPRPGHRYRLVARLAVGNDSFEWQIEHLEIVQQGR